MSKGSVVFVGDNLKYEAETLNSITERPAIGFAVGALLDYAAEKFHHDPETDKYQTKNLKEVKELVFFNNIFNKMSAILASDGTGIIDSVQQLIDLSRSDAGSFEKLFQASIKANPGLDKEPKPEPKEGEKPADPNV